MKQTLKYIYDKILKQQNQAESKFSITIALASAVIVFGASFITENNVTENILAGGCIIFALISILYSFLALKARIIKIKDKKRKKTEKNLIFYKNIINFDEFDYTNAIVERYDFPANYKIDEFDLDLARQIIATAKVVYYKFFYFNVSLVFLMMSILFAVAEVFVIGGV